MPCDFRFVGLHSAAGYILGVDPAEAPPTISIPDDSRPIPEPICLHRRAKHDAGQILEQPDRLAARSSIFLKGAGYRVIASI